MGRGCMDKQTEETSAAQRSIAFIYAAVFPHSISGQSEMRPESAHPSRVRI